MCGLITMTKARPQVQGLYLIWFRPELEMAPALVVVSNDGCVKRPEAPFPLSLNRQEDIIDWFGPIPNPDDAPDPGLCNDGNKRVWREE